MDKEGDSTILFVSTYPPRECGIATFTRDLSDAISARLPSLVSVDVLALNNNAINIYNYPKKVMMQLNDTDLNEYINSAKKINALEKIKLVCIQHEFGIFGGIRGDYLLAFLEVLKKPAIITFHSVVPKPDKHLKNVVKAIAERVKGIVVMTKKAVSILKEDYEIKSNVYIIPHGVPNVSFEPQDSIKKELRLSGRFVLSSFGMMNRGKGYEYMIEALPDIIKKHPEVIYLIVGETHPIVRKKEGESYRNLLEKRVKQLKLQKNVKFYNKYISLNELVQFLKATDIYISSSIEPNQITSGTLSYAAGVGRVTVSTPFLHAKDLITPSIGALVKFKDSKSFNKIILDLIDHPELRKEMERNAYYKTRYMTWQNVAKSYISFFEKYLNISEIETKSLPSVNTSHLERLTDEFGIIQFAEQTSPVLDSGYTLDDNARALIVCAMHYDKFREFRTLALAKKYLDYIKYVQDSNGKFFNHVNKEKNIDFDNWSEDAHGRAIWALGILTSIDSIPNDIKKEADLMLQKALPQIKEIKHLRSVAFTITGLYHYNKYRPSRENTIMIRNLADKLITSYASNASEDWKWFEDILTYGNSKIPESLIYAYKSTNKSRYLKVAMDSLNFLIANTFKDNVFIPIGEKGWYRKGKPRAYFDQQPIEVAYTVQALLAAYDLTADEEYKKKADNAFQWFLGKNTLNQVVYNESTGGCHDGIGENAINLNQGAESTLSCLMARLSFN